MKKVELSRELQCSPATITKLVSKGMPVEHDGSLDRDKCLRWIVSRTTGTRGGWNEGKRGAGLQERAQALLSGKGAANKLIKSVTACWKPPEEKPAAPVHRPVVTSGSEAHAAVVAALREITAPAEVLTFARVAVRAGCSPIAAYALATWFSIQPCLPLASVSCDDLIDFAAPREADWRGLLGKDFDLAAADDLENKIAAREVSPDSAATSRIGAVNDDERIESESRS